MPDPLPVEEAYEAWASTYDSDRNATRDLDAAVLRATPLPLDGAAVLEIGAGTGKNTAYLAARAATVLALDLSDAMLAQARRRVPGARFVRHDIRTPWPAPDASHDVVVGNLVLEHVRDLDAPFAEAARVLRRGGLLVICELHPFRQWQGSGARFGLPGAERTVEVFVHTVSEFVAAGLAAGLHLKGMSEPAGSPGQDPPRPPRLLQVVFARP